MTNEEELFKSFCLKDKITQVHADEIIQILEEWEKKIRLETLKEVLPPKIKDDDIENKLKILFRRVIWDYCHNNLNEEEVKSDVIDYILDGKGGDNKCFENFIEHYFDEIETQIRLETLKEVLPEEEKENDETDLEGSCNIDGFCRCRQEIINKAKENWNIEL